MNYRDICVLDFETGSVNPHSTQPIQVAAVMIHGRKLKIQPNGYFESLIRPILDDDEAIASGIDPIEDEALAINKKTREELKTAPRPKMVWENFIQFVNKFNYKKSTWTAPIVSGYNIENFDMVIVNRLCNEYGPLSKRGGQGLFNPIHRIDVMHDVFMWTENDPDVKSISMDSVRNWMGMDKTNAHDALQDVKDTADILIHFLKLYRHLSTKVQFAKSFQND